MTDYNRAMPIRVSIDTTGGGASYLYPMPTCPTSYISRALFGLLDVILIYLSLDRANRDLLGVLRYGLIDSISASRYIPGIWHRHDPSFFIPVYLAGVWISIYVRL